MLMLRSNAPAIMTDYYGASSTSTSKPLGQIQSTNIDTSYKSILTCLYLTMKKSKKIIWAKCSPVPALPLPPPPAPLMGLSYGEQSLCRVAPLPVHPHEEALMRYCCNPFIFEAKKTSFAPLWEHFFDWSRGVASFWCDVCLGPLLLEIYIFVSKFGKRVELVLFLISLNLKLFTAWIFW